MNEETKIYQFEDSEGNKVAPLVPEKAVVDKDGVRLDQKLEALNVNTIKEQINTAKDQAISEVEASSENLTKNVGLDEYETFSEAKEYPAGYTLLKDGLLYTFITDHAAGAWNPEEVEDGSIKKEIIKKSNITYTDNDTINKFFVNLYIDKTNYTGSENIDIIRLRTISRNTSGQWVISFETINDVVLTDLAARETSEFSRYEKTENGIYFYAEVNWDAIKEGTSNKYDVDLNKYAYIHDPRSIECLFDKNIEKKQLDINNESNKTNNDFYTFAKNNILTELDIKENEGNSYYQYNNGQLVSVPGTYKSALIEVDNNKDYFITTSLKGSSTAMAVFFDEDMAYLGYQNLNEISGQTYNYINEKLVCPKTCKFAGITRTTDIDRIIVKVISDEKIVITSVLQNKKIASIGDSITQGVQTDNILFYEEAFKPLYGDAKKTFMYYIAKENKCQWFNYGISGSTLGDCFAIGADRYGFSKENGRYTQMADDIDYMVIMFGTNDADYGMWMKAEEYIQSVNGGTYKMFPAKGHSIGEEGVMTQEEYNQVLEYSGEIGGQTYSGMDYWRRLYIGNIDDTTNKTWCGAWNTILDYIFQKYKNIKILIWLNPTNYVFDESTKAIAEKWGIPYLDMHDVAHPTIWARNEQEQTYIGGVKLNSYQQGRNLTKRDIYTADGLHPNLEGYKYIYPIINSFLKSI